MSVTQTLVPLQRIVPRERSAAVANDCLAIMPGSCLQVSHSVTFPMKRLVTPSDPTLPQLHVDLLYSLRLPAFSPAAVPAIATVAAVSTVVVEWFTVRPTGHLRYASGTWAGGRGRQPTSPFVRHFHFVWVLSGPLTIALVFPAAAAAVARVVTCVFLDHRIVCSVFR